MKKEVKKLNISLGLNRLKRSWELKSANLFIELYLVLRAFEEGAISY